MLCYARCVNLGVSMRRVMLAVFALSFAAGTTADAASCRNAAGKFIKCAAPAKPTKCRDAKGKFIACTAAAVKSG